MKRSFDRALVVGASSGIGEAVARQLVADGARLTAQGQRADPEGLPTSALAQRLVASACGD